MESGLERLVQADLHGITDWILSAKVDVHSLEPQQWLALVEVFTERITTHLDRPDALRWAPISEAYRRLLNLAQSAGVLTPPGVAIRRLNLTSVVLRSFEVDQNIDLLNPVQAIREFLKVVPLSLEEATRLSANWRDHEVSEIRRLRVVKNLLKPASQIGSRLNDGEERSRLKEWERLLPMLP